MIEDPPQDELLQRVWDGRRLTQSEARRLYFLPLEELSALADRRRELAKAEIGRASCRERVLPTV